MVGHAHLRQEVVVVSLVHMNNVEHTHWPSRRPRVPSPF